MSREVFVRNIPFGCTEEQLIEIFQEVGQVKGFHLVFDRVTGKPKGFGYCEFYDAETAASAVRNLDRREIGDRKLHVTLKGFGDDRQQQQQQQQQQQRQQQQLQSSSGIGSSSNQQSASDQITSTLTSYSTQELLNFLKDMKTYIAKNPSESRDYLKSNPQVTYTLVEALLLTNMVSKDTISKYFPLEDGSLSKSSSNSALDNIPADQMALIQQILQASPEQIEALPPDQKEYFLLIKAQMSSKP